MKLHAGGVHTFEIVELDDVAAQITPVGTDASGAYPFRIPLTSLVAAQP